MHKHIKKAHGHMHSAIKALEHAHALEGKVEGKEHKAHNRESKAIHSLAHKKTHKK